ncbi:hypothetical protein WDZ92_07605 [Nostoc sp. NIES-2111]
MLDIRFASRLRAHRGKLEFGPGPGDEVFAASFLTRREIVFDEALLSHAPDFLNICAHEVYHFVWRKLANADRLAWHNLLQAEKRPQHAGVSSRVAYERYRQRPHSRNWKHYLCEAFCDSAAALTSPQAKLSGKRKTWLESLCRRRRLGI